MEQVASQRKAELTGLGRSLFEGAPDPLLLVDPDTDRILEANSRATTLLGRDSESLAEFCFAELIVAIRGVTIEQSDPSSVTAASRGSPANSA